MALTATITLNTSSAPLEKNIRAYVTVSNPSAQAVSVLYIQPQIKSTQNSFATDRASFGVNAVPVNQYNPVPAGGSETFVFDTAFYEPSQSTYDIGCLISGSDGSLITPTPATVTITKP